MIINNQLSRLDVTDHFPDHPLEQIHHSLHVLRYINQI
jgi:hypothetical protein